MKRDVYIILIQSVMMIFLSMTLAVSIKEKNSYKSYYLDEMRIARQLAGENYQLRQQLKDSTFYPAIGRLIVKPKKDTLDQPGFEIFVKVKNFNGHPDLQDTVEYIIPVRDFCNLMSWTPHRIRVKLAK